MIIIMIIIIVIVIVIVMIIIITIMITQCWSRRHSNRARYLTTQY